MVVAALLPERTLVAEALPSRFGGGHTRLAAGPRRVDPVSLAVSDGAGAADDDGLDVARLLSRPPVAGQARRVGSLLRRLPDGPLVPTASADAPQGNPLPVVLAAWARALGARGVDRLEVMPRLRGADAFAALALACQEAGIAVETLSPRHERPLLLLDDGELVHWPSWRVVADAGQYAMLGAGLAPDVAAAVIEAAGVDGHEVWDKGFDDVGRALFVQRLERAIRGAGHGVQPGLVRLTMATVLPALSSSTSKVAALMQLPNVSERVLSLAQQHRARQQQQRAAVARLVFELRLPAPKPAWWAERLADVDKGAPIDLVSSSTTVCADVVAALAAHGVVVEEPTPGWLLAEVGDSGVGAGSPGDAGWSPRSSATPARAIGGVRSGALDLVPDVDTVPAIRLQAPPVQARQTGHVMVPANARGLRVTVDGQPLPDTEVVLGDENRHLPGTRALTLPASLASGSVVVIAWDAPEEIVTPAPVVPVVPVTPVTPVTPPVVPVAADVPSAVETVEAAAEPATEAAVEPPSAPDPAPNVDSGSES
jgi:hypothetical protein